MNRLKTIAGWLHLVATLGTILMMLGVDPGIAIETALLSIRLLA